LGITLAFIRISYFVFCSAANKQLTKNNRFLFYLFRSTRTSLLVISRRPMCRMWMSAERRLPSTKRTQSESYQSPYRPHRYVWINAESLLML